MGGSDESGRNYVLENRTYWDEQAACYTASGRRAWSSEPDWGNSTLMVLAIPEGAGELAGDRLLRPQRGMHRFDWIDTGGVEFHLSPGDWIRLLRANSFDIEDLIEVYPPAGAVSEHKLATLDWAQRWPCEEVWKVRKRR